MRKWVFGGAGGASIAADFGLLLLRVLAGLGLAFEHGIKKLPPSDGFVQMVKGVGMPGFMAWGATGAELIGGILLALGLFCRPAALLIVINLCVAIFGVHGAQPFAMRELAALYAGSAVLFLLAGPGRYSVDRLIRK
ncbi:MAG: DoxX family protein [Bryobacterales bacterium]|nr:DoxX family protein [Bryobacterales bacterium]